MELRDVDRALERSRVYFLEDGLWEIVTGLWMGLTVAVPLLLGGAVANWAPVVMLLTGLGIRPAVLAAKERWVYPRTGRVSYPYPGKPPTAPTTLGLSPASGPVAAGVPGSMGPAWGAAGAGAALAVLIGVSLEVSRRLGFGLAGLHLAAGAVVAGGLLFAAWRWGQRRWIALAVAVAALAALVAASGLDPDRALALQAAGIACALVVSGTVALAGYLRRAPKPSPETDGR